MRFFLLTVFAFVLASGSSTAAIQHNFALLSHIAEHGTPAFQGARVSHSHHHDQQHDQSHSHEHREPSLSKIGDGTGLWVVTFQSPTNTEGETHHSHNLLDTGSNLGVPLERVWRIVSPGSRQLRYLHPVFISNSQIVSSLFRPPIFA